MAINPIATRAMVIPDNPKPVPIDFSFIGDLGKSLAGYRDRQEVGRIMQGAVGPDGNLDINKAATALAVSGRDPETYLKTAIAQASENRQLAAQRALEAHHKEMERIAGVTAERPQYFHEPGGLLTDPRIIEAPRRPGQPPRVYPIPREPGAVGPASGPGPSSALPGPNFAAAVPPPGINPEEAPPYRVAGPPVPPPTQVVPGAPGAPGAPAAPVTPVVPTARAAPTPTGRNEDFLKRYPPNAQTVIKGIAEYELDPGQFGKDKEELITAAKLYRPDYKSSEYEKRGTVSPEMRARVGIAKSFLDSLDDRTLPDGRVVPGIKSRIAAGELQGQGRLAGYYGQGNAGELRAGIDEGAESLIRMLTGAGMNKEEAADYARRYRWSPVDDIAGTGTMARKVDGLEKVLRYVGKEVEGGNAGEKFLEGFRSKFGEGVAVKPVANEAEANNLIDRARAAIKRDPSARDEIIKRMRVRGIRTPELFLGQ
jgi:hypothetical protein